MTGCRDSSLKLLIKEYKADLRKLTKFELEQKNKNKSFLIDRILNVNRADFWKKVSTHRKINSQKDVLINNLELSDFVEYYENLFSHKDRLNSLFHDEIETDVRDYYQEIDIQEFSIISFKESDIRNAIKSLKNKVACGNDNIVNELIKYGLSDELVKVLSWLYNSMLKYGHIPSNFNVCLVTPIP